jgi:ubiquinone biosynthesis protein Coq4
MVFLTKHSYQDIARLMLSNVLQIRKVRHLMSRPSTLVAFTLKKIYMLPTQTISYVWEIMPYEQSRRNQASKTTEERSFRRYLS